MPWGFVEKTGYFSTRWWLVDQDPIMLTDRKKESFLPRPNEASESRSSQHHPKKPKKNQNFFSLSRDLIWRWWRPRLAPRRTYYRVVVPTAVPVTSWQLPGSTLHYLLSSDSFLACPSPQIYYHYVLLQQLHPNRGGRGEEDSSPWSLIDSFFCLDLILP